MSRCETLCRENDLLVDNQKSLELEVARLRKELESRSNESMRLGHEAISATGQLSDLQRKVVELEKHKADHEVAATQYAQSQGELISLRESVSSLQTQTLALQQENTSLTARERDATAQVTMNRKIIGKFFRTPMNSLASLYSNATYTMQAS